MLSTTNIFWNNTNDRVLSEELLYANLRSKVVLGNHCRDYED